MQRKRAGLERRVRHPVASAVLAAVAASWLGAAWASSAAAQTAASDPDAVLDRTVSQLMRFGPALPSAASQVVPGMCLARPRTAASKLVTQQA